MTVEGDILDQICWNHYGQHKQYQQTALAVDPSLTQADLNQISHNLLFNQDLLELKGITEKVLNENRELVNYGVRLPAGIKIKLFDQEEAVQEQNMIQLWD